MLCSPQFSCMDHMWSNFNKFRNSDFNKHSSVKGHRLFIAIYTYIFSDIIAAVCFKYYYYYYSYKFHLRLAIATYIVTYHFAGMFDRGKFGKFGEASAIRQTKTIQISTQTIHKFLAYLIICQTYFTKMFIHPLFPSIISGKHSCYTVISTKDTHALQN